MQARARFGAKVDKLIGLALLDREDPTALGVCRILLATVLTASLLAHAGAVAEYFSDASILAQPYARRAFPSRFSLFFTVTDPWAVRGIFAVGVVAHVLWVFGLFTRVAAAVAWLTWVSMFGRHPLLYSLADQLQMVLCTLLALMPSGRGVSLDAKWRGKGGPVPVWCRRIVQLQLAVMYTATGLEKGGVTWRGDGTALYYAMVNPYNRHFDAAPLLAHLQPYVLRPATWAVLAFEVGFAGFVALHWLRGLLDRPRRFPDLRKPFLGFGIAMHVGIQAMMYVAWFSPLALAAYAAFFRPSEARRLVDRIGNRAAGLTRGSPAGSP